MNKKAKLKLTAEQIFRPCNIDNFNFQTTEEIQPSFGVIGQDRALRALEFGLSIDGRGYNVFVSGEKDCGKSTISKIYANKFARLMEMPQDWIVVNNFKGTNSPKILPMKTGAAQIFVREYQKIMMRLFEEIPAFFESDEYQAQREPILNKLAKGQEVLIAKLENLAKKQSIKIRKTPTGFSTIPVFDGKEVSTEKFDQLETQIQKKLQRSMENVQRKIFEVLKEIHLLEQEAESSLEVDVQKMLGRFIDVRFNHLEEKYAGNDKVVKFLQEVVEEICASPTDFMESQSDGENKSENATDGEALIKYAVKVLVDHASLEHAPVIYEMNPTYKNLFGYIEKESILGVFQTNFTKIHVGALYQANGGILILDAESLISHPHAWTSLKRALRTKIVVIEDSSESTGAPDIASLKPQPVPLNIKVILIGHPRTFHLMDTYDNEFNVLFKVRADFDDETEYSEISINGYAEFIARVCREENKIHFCQDAVARLVEHGSRLAANKNKLSLRLGTIKSVIDESNFWAKHEKHKCVQRTDVDKSISENRYRSGLLEQKIGESITNRTVLIDVKGSKIGQINGLVVYQVGDYDFGKPTRISVRTYCGTKGLINIEREVELSGKIHDKGVLIITGFLGDRFAQTRPLSLNAMITFEQSYGGVDGDSASSTELYALLSSISDVPLSQEIAVTGSVSQNGDIQAIGGVNEKIEGFFEICRNRGLTGSQGVIIPYANVKNLMLNEDVRKMIDVGKFNIWAIQTIDDGIEILTGQTAASINSKVQRKLNKFLQKKSIDN